MRLDSPPLVSLQSLKPTKSGAIYNFGLARPSIGGYRSRLPDLTMLQIPVTPRRDRGLARAPFATFNFRRETMKRNSILVCLTVFLAAMMSVPALGLTGAVYTTDGSCTGVNLNIFDSKQDVFLDGGPRSDNSKSGLPDGFYWVRVTEPDGTVLGTSAGALVEVEDGSFVECYNLFALTNFADTTNAGGEYKVWASQNSSFPASESATDNFKVEASTPPPPPPPAQGTLIVQKFYDSNADGSHVGEALISGWKVTVDGVEQLTTYNSGLIDVGSYAVNECSPTAPSTWVHTTSTSATATVTEGGTETIRFGNLCLGGGGGHTLGFWSNKNGQKIINTELTILAEIQAKVCGLSGTDYATFRTWLLNATATNMAYMLSAQYAAMYLNINLGDVDELSYIYAPGTDSANELGFALLSDVMAEAEAILASTCSILSGDPLRDRAEAVKNAIDKANNNQNFVQPAGACELPSTFNCPE
jgi:hypothetical protein